MTTAQSNARAARIAELEDRIGEAGSCSDGDCSCGRYLNDDRDELAALKQLEEHDEECILNCPVPPDETCRIGHACEVCDAARDDEGDLPMEGATR